MVDPGKPQIAESGEVKRRKTRIAEAPLHRQTHQLQQSFEVLVILYMIYIDLNYLAIICTYIPEPIMLIPNHRRHLRFHYSPRLLSAVPWQTDSY
jgi:hypothetical protein